MWFGLMVLKYNRTFLLPIDQKTSAGKKVFQLTELKYSVLLSSNSQPPKEILLEHGTESYDLQIQQLHSQSN